MDVYMRMYGDNIQNKRNFKWHRLNFGRLYAWTVVQHNRRQFNYGVKLRTVRRFVFRRHDTVEALELKLKLELALKIPTW